MDFTVDFSDEDMSFLVYIEITEENFSVDFCLPVLTHHNERGCIGGLE